MRYTYTYSIILNTIEIKIQSNRLFYYRTAGNTLTDAYTDTNTVPIQPNGTINFIIILSSIFYPVVAVVVVVCHIQYKDIVFIFVVVCVCVFVWAWPPPTAITGLCTWKKERRCGMLSALLCSLLYYILWCPHFIRTCTWIYLFYL